ncbi:phosphoribosylanthranilate isomerase [Calothrix sp. NIES-4071]|nr:phosphoribosylanthranilate isomerase [Calothrix sp. NIES-4071]BAZ63850.1 phosphoribosylanthranilate isomerase [Calothrix sp. NIES-4105]
MRIKICGIRDPLQGQAIAATGATALGFICVQSSPRYVSVEQIQSVVALLPSHMDKIGVFANANPTEIAFISNNCSLTGVQLHGNESPDFCKQIREILPDIEIIKALRIRNTEDLNNSTTFTDYVDTLLLDAYHPQQLGGTGQTLDWKILEEFNPGRPWFLAGGLTPDNITSALTNLKPNGIDLSSGVEKAPADKDLDKVAKLFQELGVLSESC